MKRCDRRLFLAGAAATAAVAVPAEVGAEIHNGGVDCTNWNGVYRLVGASAKERLLLPEEGDVIRIAQDRPSGVDMTVTIGGEEYRIEARTNGSANRRTTMIKGRPVRVYGSWIDGYGKNWIVQLTPDPLRPGVPHSVREYLLTYFHTIVVQATIHDPRNQVPLATFPQTSRRIGGTKVKDIVDGRAVYMMDVKDTPEPSVQLRELRGTRSR